MSLSQQAANLVNQGQFIQAESIYHALLDKDKADGSAYLGLGNIALATHQFDQAISLFTQACHILAKSTLPLLQLATAFNAVCAEQDALTVLNYAHKTFPDSAQVHYQLAQQHLILGEFDLATNALRSALHLASGPITSHILFELVRLQRYSKQDIQMLQQRLSSQYEDLSQQTVLHYALGNVRHAAQDYSGAWQHFAQANRIQQQSCDFTTQQLKTFYSQTQAVATPAILSQRRSVVQDEITPIFIVGLPRSGSTLLEQILARHPLIAAAGELPYLSREVDEYLYQQNGQHYPHSLQGLSDQQIEQAATIYLTALSRHARNKPLVIDKLPANFQSIGLIYKLFPKAKIIHISRHPAAVAFSVFRNYFAANEPYFCCLAQFKQYQRYYLDLMSHWHRVIPGFIFELSYEQLLADKQLTIQRLLAFCGVDWDNACLNNSHVDSPITTLSNIQARSAIMTSSKTDWLHYQAHLQAFLPANSDVQAV